MSHRTAVFITAMACLVTIGLYIGLYLLIPAPKPYPQFEIGRYIQLGGTPLVLDTATGKVCDPRMYDNKRVYPVCIYDTIITHQVGRYQQFGMGAVIIDTATGRLIDTYTQLGNNSD